MKNLRFAVFCALIAACCFWVVPARAQWGSIKDAAKKAAKKKAQVDDSSSDSNSSNNNPNSTTTPNQPANGAPPASTDAPAPANTQQQYKSYQNYDFVPGD